MGERQIFLKKLFLFPLHKGKKELIKTLKGEPLTRGEAILAKCYDCMGGYEEGAMDCKIETCPLYDFMPYREGGPRKTRKAPKKKP